MGRLFRSTRSRHAINSSSDDASLGSACAESVPTPPISVSFTPSSAMRQSSPSPLEFAEFCRELERDAGESLTVMVRAAER